MFAYFPHNPPAPDWLPPSVVVHEGDWKLYNLREDIGEKNNLAAPFADLRNRHRLQIGHDKNAPKHIQ